MIWWDGELWLVGDERGGPIGVICLENTMAQLKGVNGVNDGVNGVICTDYLLIDLPTGGAPPPGVGVGSIPASGVLPKISSVGKGARVNDVNVQQAKEQVTSLTGRPWEAGKPGKPGSKAGAAEGVDEVMRKRSTSGRGALADRVEAAKIAHESSVELRTKEIMKMAFEEWSNDVIDTEELDKRKAGAPKQAAAENQNAKTLDKAFSAFNKAVAAGEKAWEAYNQAADEEEAAEAAVLKALEAME